MPRLVVIGAGGAGRETLEVIEAINHAGGDGATTTRGFEVVGVLDDAEPDERLLRLHGVRHLGPISHLHHLDRDVQYVVGIGAPAVRRRVDREFRDTRASPVLRHPEASIGRLVTLGPGSMVCAGARLTTSITCGRHVHVNVNASIGHDARLDDYVQISPLAAVSGYVHLEPGVMVGTAASINPGLQVGLDAVVGAGAAVIRDVSASTTVVGVPARPLD